CQIGKLRRPLQRGPIFLRRMADPAIDRNAAGFDVMANGTGRLGAHHPAIRKSDQPGIGGISHGQPVRPTRSTHYVTTWQGSAPRWKWQVWQIWEDGKRKSCYT